MIKTLFKIAFFGVVGYLIFRYPGTVGDLAANTVIAIRDTATAFFTKIS